LPTLTLSANAVSLCSGQTATVQANTNTPVTYTWSNGVNTSSVSLNSAGVFSCNVSNACGNASESVTVTIGALPSTTASATQTLLCSGQTTTLSTSGIGTYLWSNGATTQTTSVSNSGVYTVTLTNGCGSAVSSVTISSQVTPTVSLSASSSTICTGQSSTITANSNVNNYSWSTGSFTNTTVVNTSGVVTVTVSNSCGVATASTAVFSNTLPILNLTSSSTTICPNETATLTVTGGSEPYSWSNTSSTGSVVTTNGGTVTVSNTNACGTATAANIVTVANLNASISANPISGTTPLTVDFINSSVGATTYLWDFGNGTAANTQTVSSQTYNVVGSYVVYLLVTSGSCLDIDSLTINVLNQAGTLVIPNVFTPNGDSINDIFRVTGFNINDFNCTIFDRWGLQMFAWDGIKNGWDGKTNDKDVPDGTYFYIINAKDIDGVEIKKQGTVNLFK
jgi:gliding motility-associated-like protein